MGYCDMLVDGFTPDNFVVPNALKACGGLGLIGAGRGVHGFVMKMGFGDCVYVASSLVDMYGKCGLLQDARKVFDKMLERNAVVWNSMIASYVQNGLNEEAIRLLVEMRKQHVEPTRVTVASFLSASANLDAVKEGRQGHALAVLCGLDLDNILGSSLINFYCKVGLVEEAEIVFSRIVRKDVVSWNLLVSCYVQCGSVEKALDTCRVMRLEGLRFDSVTLASIMSACADTSNLKLGLEGHCYCIRNNLDSDAVVASSIIDTYGKCGRLEYARSVFESAPHRDIVLWNTMLAAYAEMGLSGEALKLFYQMQLEGVPPNNRSWNTVILGYMRNGLVDEARDMFLQMQSSGIDPNLITWTIMISGLVQNGLGYDAIYQFQKMWEFGIRPNIATITSVLSACTLVTSLRHGKVIHGHTLRNRLCESNQVSTSLVDMYAKCGCLMHAKRVFSMIASPQLSLYNAMISGYALHGEAAEAFELFKHLQQEDVEVDGLTFTCVLSACYHAGLVDEGVKLFVDTIKNNHLKPSLEHYGCLVRLLSRCGKLDEALEIMSEMPFEPDGHIVGSLLAASQQHGSIELTELLSQALLELESDDGGNYVALSNAYAASERWNEASALRGVMREKGIRKSPGCSWIQIGDEVHAFAAGDWSHPEIYTIRLVLGLLVKEMQHMGRAPVNK
uniref:Chlororespiratory reduction 21 n=1 Tax=Kalanchoe fedtschenkoi TaxID=63787 RepID=A0A7N0V7G3_KALFE